MRGGHSYSELLPLSPPTALGGSLPFTFHSLIRVCLKTEELRWGSPTATPPFEPLDFAPKRKLIDIFVLP